MLQFHALPNECVLLILKYLEPYQVLLLSHTGRWIRDLAISESVWRELCLITCASIPTYQIYFQVYQPFKSFVGFYQSDHPFYKGDLISISFVSPTNPMEPMVRISRKCLGDNQPQIPFSQLHNISIETPTNVVNDIPLYTVHSDGKLYCSKGIQSAKMTVVQDLIRDASWEMIPNGNPNPDTGIWGFRNQYGSSTTLAEGNSTIIQFHCDTYPKTLVRTPTGVIEYCPKLSKCD
jgi:hypothetical protein